MTFEEAIKQAKKNNLPYKYTVDMIHESSLTQKAKTKLKNDFILMVETLM